MNEPVVLLVALAFTNLVAFGLFGWDKRCASADRRRVPEARLLVFAWAGGFVGALLAMKTFRHKTQKRSFQVKLAAVIVLNLAWPAVWYVFFRGEPAA